MTTSEVHTPDTGSLLGPWRILERIGSGTFGIVYAVCLAEDPGAGEFALKLAREAGDPRFEREGELLSRLHHRHVPGLRDRGVWRDNRGRWHPYLVMQWVEGLPLYLWAKQRGVTSRQVLRVLAQVARALEATHLQGLHRDVKGDNVLVTSEGDAVLVDYGCCWYEGARELTMGMLPPGTRAYRSAQALRHEREGSPANRYTGTPADDVYALGVTAYHLVTGTYPPQGTEDVPRLLPPSELATVAPELEALILRMLSEEPEARGTAGELAEALEQAAKSAEPWADERVRPSRSMLPTERASRPGPTRWHLARQAFRRHSKYLAVAGALAACLLGVLLLPPLPEQPQFAVEEAEPEDAGVDERVVGVADGGVDDAVLAAAHDFPRAEVMPGLIGREMPKDGFPRQRKPPCTERGERAIKGACWFGPLEGEKSPCGSKLFDYDGRCYVPSFNSPRQPTSQDP
jgi:hypothetical protein